MCENHRQSIPSIYEIRVSGRLSPELADWLGGLSQAVSQAPYGSTFTVLHVPVVDQSALFGILARIRDLGLKLVSVNQMEQGMDLLNEQNEANERGGCDEGK